jgi:hypothetical protein
MVALIFVGQDTFLIKRFWLDGAAAVADDTVVSGEPSCSIDHPA